MKWVADENVDRQIVDALRVAGHEINYISESAPGTADEDILKAASSEGALLLTADKDFGELVFRQGQASTGVVLIRLAGIPPKKKASLVATAIRRHAEEMKGSFTVIAVNAIRIRMP